MDFEDYPISEGGVGIKEACRVLFARLGLEGQGYFITISRVDKDGLVDTHDAGEHQAILFGTADDLIGLAPILKALWDKGNCVQMPSWLGGNEE